MKLTFVSLVTIACLHSVLALPTLPTVYLDRRGGGPDPIPGSEAPEDSPPTSPPDSPSLPHSDLIRERSRRPYGVSSSTTTGPPLVINGGAFVVRHGDVTTTHFGGASSPSDNNPNGGTGGPSFGGNGNGRSEFYHNGNFFSVGGGVHFHHADGTSTSYPNTGPSFPGPSDGHHRPTHIVSNQGNIQNVRISNWPGSGSQEFTHEPLDPTQPSVFDENGNISNIKFIQGKRRSEKRRRK